MSSRKLWGNDKRKKNKIHEQLDRFYFAQQSPCSIIYQGSNLINISYDAMPRYYCDYCDTYLTHDSPSVRKQHNAGYKHKANVRLYYQQYEAQLNQSLIDQKVKEHLGAFRPPGPPLGVPYNQLRPGVAILPTPMMPMSGTTTFPPGAPFMSIRPPVLPRPPPGAPVYMSSTMPMPMMMAPPPSGPLPGPPPTDMQRPPSMTAPPPIGMAPSSGAPPSFYNPVYQGAAPTSAATGETPNNASAQAHEAADN